MRKLLFIFVIISAILLWSCEYTAFEEEDLPEVDNVRFSTDIEPIFTEQGCTNCHNGGQDPDLTTGNAYNSITSNPDYIDLDSEVNIYIVAAPSSSHYANYTGEQAAKVKAWLEDGAPDN